MRGFRASGRTSHPSRPGFFQNRPSRVLPPATTPQSVSPAGRPSTFRTAEQSLNHDKLIRYGNSAIWVAANSNHRSGMRLLSLESRWILARPGAPASPLTYPIIANKMKIAIVVKSVAWIGTTGDNNAITVFGKRRGGQAPSNGVGKMSGVLTEERRYHRDSSNVHPVLS